jgi:hypothetical protein
METPLAQRADQLVEAAAVDDDGVTGAHLVKLRRRMGWH